MGRNYFKDDNIEVGYMSSLEIEEARTLLGKTILKISATEYGLELTFTDNSSLYIRGNIYNGCPLDVVLSNITGVI